MKILSYLFTSAPGALAKFNLYVIGLGVFLILFSIVFSYIYKKKKKEDFAFKRLFKGVNKVALIFGIILLLYAAVRYENIPYFSMRIWIYIALIILLYFVYKYIKKYKIDYPREKQNVQSITEKVKKEEMVYLPHKKKK